MAFTPSANQLNVNYERNDNPMVIFPLASDKAKFANGVAPVIPAAKLLTATTYTETFTLDVAVRTTDPAGATQYFSQARAAWNFYANGTLDQTGKWQANPGAMGGIVTSPNSWLTQLVTTPTLIDTGGTIANNMIDKLTFE